MGVPKPDEKENQIKADKIVQVEKCTKKLNQMQNHLNQRSQMEKYMAH